MNRILKHGLRESFEAPKPIRKKEFLSDIQTAPLSPHKFIFLQMAYIQKWVWLVSVLIFGISLIGARYIGKDMLWIISAFMPVLALSVISESSRSQNYGMAELELSTRFSLKSIVLARLFTLGIFNFILIVLLIPMAVINNQFDVLQTSIYIVCPYLLTAFCGLWVVRKVHSKESSYFCLGIAVCISFTNTIIYQTVPVCFAEHNFIWWIMALILLSIGAARQCYQMIKQTEELAWNL